MQSISTEINHSFFKSCWSLIRRAIQTLKIFTIILCICFKNNTSNLDTQQHNWILLFTTFSNEIPLLSQSSSTPNQTPSSTIPLTIHNGNYQSNSQLQSVVLDLTEMDQLILPQCYVFSNMKVAQQPQHYFDKNQFLLANSVYSTDLKDQWNALYEDEIPDPPPEINNDNNATDGLQGQMQDINHSGSL
ncbi:hypothetical protein PSHT_01308 [Puccinia striiformis]|uniref:Uncharacterized protein n=1 Tax=Puccinia striiformis TaxID=27350 RepID=A0A2S4WKZ2_9BASI|nr:hypothetical protein PSHT_01308 [Puccinia striiformis]